MRVIHSLDSWNVGGIQELVLLLGKHSAHSHATWGYAGSMTPYLLEAGIPNFEGGPPESEHFDVVVGHTVGGWSHENLSKWAHDHDSKFVECMHSNAFSPTPQNSCDGFVALSEMCLNLNRHMSRAVRIYGICEVDRFWGHTGNYIGRMSRLADEKRPQDLLVIANCFRGEKFLLGGDGALYQSLKEQSPMNLTMTGLVRDFPDFYSRLKLFVFPTRDECCAMSFAMAQAAGLPCVVQDLPQLRETSGGYALFANDIPEFVSQVKKFLDNPQDYEEMASLGHEWAKKTFDTSVTVTQWDDYLVDICSNV